MTSPWVRWTCALRVGSQSAKAASISAGEAKLRPSSTPWRTMATWRSTRPLAWRRRAGATTMENP